MKRFLPYLLPVISIIFLIGSILFLDNNNGVTGFTIADTGKYPVNSDVRLEILEGQTIPGDALIVVSLDNREASMKISDFVVKAGGEEKENYEGKATFALGLSEFNIDNKVEKGNHAVGVKLVYKDSVIFESNSEVDVG